MASIMANSLRAGKKAKDSQGYDTPLSKALDLNGDYRIFMRKFYNEAEECDDIATAIVPGRSLDLKICGSTFIPYKPNMFELDDAGHYHDLTVLDSWARIARVLFDASCAREKKLVELEAEAAAKDLGVAVNRDKLDRQINLIEQKYYGGRHEDGTKANPTESPAISGLQLKMATQLLLIKMNPDGSPDFKNARLCTYEFSREKLDEVIAALDDPNCCIPEADYIELGYSYKGADKKEAGHKAHFKSIAKEVSLAAKFPKEWEAEGKKQVDRIAKGKSMDDAAAIMRSRNRNMCSTTSASDIVSAMRKWCANNSAIFASIDVTKDSTKWAANDFLDSAMLDAVPAIKEKFEKLAAELEAERAGDEEEATVVEEAAPEAEAADAVAAIATGEGASTVKQMAAVAGNVDLGDGDLSDLD